MHTSPTWPSGARLPRSWMIATSLPYSATPTDGMSASHISRWYARSDRSIGRVVEKFVVSVSPYPWTIRDDELFDNPSDRRVVEKFVVSVSPYPWTIRAVIVRQTARTVLVV